MHSQTGARDHGPGARQNQNQDHTHPPYLPPLTSPLTSAPYLAPSPPIPPPLPPPLTSEHPPPPDPPPHPLGNVGGDFVRYMADAPLPTAGVFPSLRISLAFAVSALECIYEAMMPCPKRLRAVQRAMDCGLTRALRVSQKCAGALVCIPSIHRRQTKASIWMMLSTGGPSPRCCTRLPPQVEMGRRPPRGRGGALEGGFRKRRWGGGREGRLGGVQVGRFGVVGGGHSLLLPPLALPLG